MTVDELAGDWFCTKCARPAGSIQRSVDPRYVLGVCAWVDEVYGPKGHGLVPVVRRRDDALLLVDRARRRAATGRHATHDPKYPNRDCDRCSWADRHRDHVALRRVDRACPLCQDALARARPLSIGPMPAGRSPAGGNRKGGPA